MFNPSVTGLRGLEKFFLPTALQAFVFGKRVIPSCMAKKSPPRLKKVLIPIGDDTEVMDDLGGTVSAINFQFP